MCAPTQRGPPVGESSARRGAGCAADDELWWDHDVDVVGSTVVESFDERGHGVLGEFAGVLADGREVDVGESGDRATDSSPGMSTRARTKVSMRPMAQRSLKVRTAVGRFCSCMTVGAALAPELSVSPPRMTLIWSSK